jgi:2-phospho-L-lactate guanylyltransferase
MSSDVTAIVPIKALAAAKSRLGGVLSDSMRQRLVLEMLAGVIRALRAAPRIESIVVVSPDEGFADRVLGSKTTFLHEPGGGDLNSAVRLAVRHALEAGARVVIIVPADVPLITAEDVERLAAPTSNGRSGSVRIVPAHDGHGTNGLRLEPPGALTPSYGQGSLSRHVASAHAARLAVVIEEIANLGFDVDVPADVARLARDPGYDWLARTDENK